MERTASAGPGDVTPVIRTPDQRLRVFVSSTLGELAPERRAARVAVEQLRLAPVLFELGARPHPPRTLYRAYLAQSHVFVGIYWQSYGWVAPGMEISGVEDELRLRGAKPCLVYVKDPAPDREPRLRALLAQLKADDRVSYAHFATPEELAALLVDDLAVLLAERFEQAGGDREEIAGPRPARPLPTPPTPLIGREGEVARLAGLLAGEGPRLVTLTGIGGVGKSRLAVAAASEAAAGHPDGVCFVDLAPVREPEAVAEVIAAAVGIRGEGRRPIRDTVLGELRDARLLLVLDNVEQVAGAAPFVGELLAACAGVTVLATSRVPLRLRGEREVRVEPLAGPPPGRPVTDADLLEAPATRLFLDRAADTGSGFEPAAGDADAVAELCRRLDGLPLAIELAAARVRVMPPGALLERLGRRLDLAAGAVDLPERQRTLRATLDWSHALLGPQARGVLARLSVFPSSFTLAAAADVGAPAPGDDVLDALAELVEHSLVVPAGASGPEPRFRMLEIVREYAAERLAEGGDADAVQRRMADHLAGVAAEAGEGLATARHREWVERLDADGPALWAALAWTMERGDVERALRLWAPIWIYYWVRGAGELAGMGRRLEAFAASAAALEPGVRAMFLWALGNLRFAVGDFAGAATALREDAELARSLGDRRAAAYADALWAFSARDPDVAGSATVLAGAAATFRELGDGYGTAYVTSLVGVVAALRGDLDEGVRLLDEALSCARAVESDQMTGQALVHAALLEIARGDLDAAHARLAEAAAIDRAIRMRVEGLDYVLDALAALALARGMPGAAARALGAARAIREPAGYVVWPCLQPWADRVRDEVRAALGPAAFEAAVRAGGGVRTEDAVEAALAATAPGSGGR